ncbi:YitT family protein [Clostridium sp. NSJ-49]|uniref:YitT family protein n=1 Tax=Clostridium TaxID=1485 RepID=UPI00164B26E4|nr:MULTISPECIES: YitT family protein [unclassified Clostridium]MBC5624465.1 YitT family protein [Clostridium sp. NSJ-49]MCD2501854.1 YitT family protein [Clostridium sp. NSJ-145]
MKDLLKSKNFYIDVVVIILGCFIYSLGVNLFLTNAKLVSGGVTGIALILQYVSDIPSGITVFLLNIPLFFISYKFLSKRFTLYTAIGMLSISLSLIITKPLSALIQVNDILLYCIYGGVLCGIGMGLVFYRNGSTGGIDIITMVIRKKYSNFEIGKLNFGFNLIIVAIAAIIFGLPQALYTLISMFIQGTILDKVLNGFTSKKLLLILTEKENEIINYVINDLHRGITSIMAEGEYTHSKKKMLYVAITSSQFISLKNKILRIDPKAFITIIDASEVKGKGFINI